MSDISVDSVLGKIIFVLGNNIIIRNGFKLYVNVLSRNKICFRLCGKSCLNNNVFKMLNFFFIGNIVPEVFVCFFGFGFCLQRVCLASTVCLGSLAGAAQHTYCVSGARERKICGSPSPHTPHFLRKCKGLPPPLSLIWGYKICFGCKTPVLIYKGSRIR